MIQDTVGSCHVLIAIIGRHWTTVTDASNRRRLDLADDYVRSDEGTLTLAGWLIITIESKEGSAFVGHGQVGYSQFPVRLVPN